MIKKEYYKYVILLACMFPYCMSSLVRWNYTSISGYLVADFGIGKPELGMLASLFFYSYALSQIPSGLAVDRWGGRWVIPGGIFLMGFCSFGFAMSQSYTQLMIFRTLLGILGATVYVPAAQMLGKWFPASQRGLANNVFNGFGGGLGEVLMFLLVPFIALVAGNGLFGITGWRLSTCVVAVVIILIAILSFIFLRSDPSDIGLESPAAKEEGKVVTPEETKQIRKRLLKDPLLYGLGLIWSGYIVSGRLVLGWTATYAAAYYAKVMNMPAAEAMVAGGAIASTYVIGRYIGAPVSGIICDYLLKKYMVPRTAVLGTGLAGWVVLFCCMAVVEPSVTTLSVMTFIAGFLQNFGALTNACAAEFWTVKVAGLSMGIVNTMAQFLGAVSLSVSGYAAVKFAVTGGAFHTEYSGIWYCGVVATAVAFIVTMLCIRRERAIWASRQKFMHTDEVAAAKSGISESKS